MRVARTPHVCEYIIVRGGRLAGESCDITVYVLWSFVSECLRVQKFGSWTALKNWEILKTVREGSRLKIRRVYNAKSVYLKTCTYKSFEVELHVYVGLVSAREGSTRG